MLSSCPPRLCRSQAAGIRRLHHKKGRRAAQRFLLEGEKVIAEVLTAGHPIDYLVGTPAFLTAHAAQLHAQGIRCWQATPELLTRISALKDNKSALAVLPLPKPQPLPAHPPGRVIVLDGLQDPGNMGTIFRIASWYGIRQIVCAPDTVDGYNPKVLQASRGAFLHVAWHYTPLPAWLDTYQGAVLGAVLEEAPWLDQVELPTQGALLIGHEGQGIRGECLPFVTCPVTIRGGSPVGSLNAAVAAGICCERWVNA